MSVLSRLRRQLDFARHVPVRQIARRLQLTLRRRLEAKLRPDPRPGPLRRSLEPPLPLFPPRVGMVARRSDGWRFCFLGREVVTPEQIDWSAPCSTPGDQLWRMNLHYMEYLEEVDDAQFEALVRAWISAVPPFVPGATDDGWNSYALSLRVVVWMQQLAARADRLDSPFSEMVEKSLTRQLLYLERHLETDIGGNHLLKNIKALLWASAFFQGPAAERWCTAGVALLRRELSLQILPDGVHFELSPAYHCQVFADLIEIRHVLGSDPCGGALDDCLARAAQAAADLTHPDGAIAQFGDSGLSMSYKPSTCQRAFAALYDRPAPGPRPLWALDDAGYFGARDDGAYFVMDAGRIAPASLPGHGHGDIFSFEWSVGGERLIVDQGVFEYVAGEKRQLSRTAASHNTLVVAGGDQAEFFGAFRSARHAKVEIIQYKALETGFVLEARHFGFRRLPGSPVHRRRFDVSARQIQIQDRIEGTSRLSATAALLLAPGATVERVGPADLQVTCGRARVSIASSLPIEIEPAVWWPDMGVEHLTQRLVVRLVPPARELQMKLEALS